MKDLGGENTVQNAGSCSEAAVKAELDRILVSETFQGSQRPRGFLRYVVELTLAGREDQIKEYSIATDVFGRDETFDPRLDPIVRVEATKLRSRLAAYYTKEGREDSLRIDLPKRGYVPTFRNEPIPPLSETGNPVPADAVAPKVQPIAKWSARKTWWIAAGILLLGAGGFALVSVSRRHPRPADERSIAVLPFANLGDSREDEYFSDGLTDELIASLGRVPGVRVAARGSVFQFKNKTYDVREVGRKLNVRTVLEGSVRKFGGRLRITVHLDDSSNGYHIWSEIYDRDARDALTIQREIATALSSSLGVNLATQNGPALNASASRSTPVDPEAYQAYLKGLFFWNKNTAASIRTALEYFQEAAGKDPNYAPIYTGMGRCYEGLPVFTSMSSVDAIPKIREVAMKALALDPSLGEAHLQLGEAAFLEYKWPEAERELKKALELSPGDGVVHRFYSYYLGRMGRNEEALAETLAAQTLDPVSPYLAEGVGQSYVNLRRYDDAIEQYKKGLMLDPSYIMLLRGLGLAYVYRGEYGKGIGELERAAKLDPEDVSVRGELGYAYAVSGKRALAEQVLSALLQQSREGRARPIRVAQVYIGLGDRDHAFEWLLKAADQHEIALGPKTDAMFDPLRSDSRFSELLRRMNLLQVN